MGQLREALKVAKEQGYAIVIGQMKAGNVEFVTISQLISHLQAK